MYKKQLALIFFGILLYPSLNATIDPSIREAFFQAITNDNKKMIRKLLYHNMIDSKELLTLQNRFMGNTPLHLAAEIGSQDIVEILLRKGANKSIKNFQNMTAADVAIQSGYPGLAELLK